MRQRKEAREENKEKKDVSMRSKQEKLGLEDRRRDSPKQVWRKIKAQSQFCNCFSFLHVKHFTTGVQNHQQNMGEPCVCRLLSCNLKWKCASRCNEANACHCRIRRALG